MAHTPRVLTLPEVGEASAELVSDDFPVFHWQHDVRICFHRFRDLAQGDTGTGDERFKQDVA